MRLSTVNDSLCEKNKLAKFSTWLLSVGNGTIREKKTDSNSEEDTFIQIPDKLFIKHYEHPIQAIIDETYPDFLKNYNNSHYITERAIITPTNEIVDIINMEILKLINEEDKVYYSFDSMCKTSSECEELNILYPIEFLNSLNFNGFPQHELRLKKIFQ